MTDERKFEDGLMTHSEKGDQIEWVEKYQFDKRDCRISWR